MIIMIVLDHHNTRYRYWCPSHVEKVISMADPKMPKKYRFIGSKHRPIEEYEFHGGE